MRYEIWACGGGSGWSVTARTRTYLAARHRAALLVERGYKVAVYDVGEGELAFARGR